MQQDPDLDPYQTEKWDPDLPKIGRYKHWPDPIYKETFRRAKSSRTERGNA